MFKYVERFLRVSVLVLLAVLTLVSVALAQTVPELPGIDEIVTYAMAMFGTYAAAYAANYLRALKIFGVDGKFFVGLIVPILGVAVSLLTTQVLGKPGNPYLVSLFATFGSVWLSQVQAQLNGRSGPEQYVLGGVKRE